jgi:hypothetical protein
MPRIPYLLLDIDGVLVPFPAEGEGIPPTHTRHRVRMTGRPDPVPVWLDQRHGPLITDAVATGLIRPVWCTSWRADAPGVIGPVLGLPVFEHIDLPWLPITTSHPDGYLWKRDHVDSWLRGAPAVWIDDDFTPLDFQWAADRTADGHPTLLIQPDPYVGLQPGHIRTALDWATGLGAAPEAAWRQAGPVGGPLPAAEGHPGARPRPDGRRLHYSRALWREPERTPRSWRY